MPAVEFRVHDRNSGAYLTSLANASDRQCQDVDNDTGTGGVTLGLADGDLGAMAEGNIVRCYVDGVVAYSWVVGPMDQATVTADEEAGEERRISGRGTLGLWADGIVYPETGGSGVTFPPLSERRVVDVRRFDFAAVGYDDSGWPGAVVVPPPPALVPLDGTPSGWPLESQDWIWSRARSGDNHPAGHSYFRHTFAVGPPTQASIFITADNGFEIFLDGEMLLSEMRTPLLWPFSRSVQVDLLPGAHLIAVKAVNHAVAGIPQNPAGVAMVIVALDTSGDPTSVIATTGAGWKCADYPAEPPGMTVGRIITDLYNEAQARGALSGLTLGFSPTHDSAGVPWPNAPDVALPVGDDYLQVLRKLSELYCDVAMDPGSLRLDAWVSRGTNRSGSVSFGIGTNITSLSHKGGEQSRASAILGRFGDHWLERNGGGRRQEKFLELGSATSTAQAQRMSDAALAERAYPIITTTTAWEPTAGTVPWVHFQVGDQVAVPNASGAMVAGRVKSISLNETEDDYDFVAEVGSMESDIIDRLHRMARKAGHGALDFTFANATASTGSEGAMDSTGGYLTSATPDISLNSLTDVASVWDEPPESGDFLAWNPDLGMAGMWEPASVVQDVGTTVVFEQDFGLDADPGLSSFPSAEDHTHGTPLPRHPQEGYPYVDFSSGAVVVGCTPGELHAAYFGTEDHATYLRSTVTSPTGAQGWGRAAAEWQGHDDGSALLFLYNDLDINGSYETGTVGNPFSVAIQGHVELQAIDDDPDPSPGNRARLYFNSSTGTVQISEDGGPYRDIGGGDVEFGVTVVGEQSFGQATAVGDALTVAHADHSHGTPLPRHPQVGWPYVGFDTPGLISLGRVSTEHGAGLISTELLTGASRTFMTSPIPVNGGGRATVSLVGKDNGNAIVHFYNDLDVDGQYGAGSGGASKPFGIELEGDFTFQAIANTPPLAPVNQAKIYFNSAVQKLQISQNGGAYVDLVGGGSGVGVGAAGTFLVTNNTASGTTWTANTEFVVSAGRVGVGTSSPSTRLSVTGGSGASAGGAASGILGLSTGTGSGTDEYLSLGIVNGSYAWIQAVKPGTAWRNLVLAPSGGNVGIGVTDPTHKLHVGGIIGVRGATGEFDAGIFQASHTPSYPNGPAGARLTLASPLVNNTHGRAILDVAGDSNGDGGVRLFNDRNTDGTYGDTPGTAAPLWFELQGTMVFKTIGASGVFPAVSAGGTARVYYEKSTGNLVLSENGSAYRTIGEIAPGAAGSFLVTNSTGTGTMWAATTEIYFDDVNNRIGIGASSPQERLAVRDGTAGLISTFFGPVGGNSSIAVGADKFDARSLQIGYNGAGDYGWLSVYGDAAGEALVIDWGGNVGIGRTSPGAKLDVNGTIQTTDLAYYIRVGTSTGSHVSIGPTYAGDWGLRIHSTIGGVLPTRFPAVDIISGTTTLRVQSGAQTGTAGQASSLFESNADGTSRLWMFNGLKTNGTYGTGAGRAFRVQIEGGNVNSNLSSNCTLGLITNADWCGLGMHAGATQCVMRVSTLVTGFSFADGGATAYVPLHASAFTVNSSRSSKQGIQPMTSPATPALLSLKPVTFDRPGLIDGRGKRGPVTHHRGLVAEEVVDVIPEAVSWMEGKPMGLDYVPITATLIQGFQEHDRAIATLRKECGELERQNADLTARLDALASAK